MTFLPPRRPPISVPSWGPGYATFEYPNNNRPSTIWYHDHTLGMTRLNVYAGPAGFYILRGKDSGAWIAETGTEGRSARPCSQRR